jgi:Tol biopolymer transport system component
MMRNKVKMKFLLVAPIALLVFALTIYFVFLNKGTLSVKVLPKTASVLINNAPQTVNNSGIAKSRLIPGVYTLRITIDGYVPYYEQFRLRGGSITEKNIELKTVPKVSLLDQSAALLERYSDSQISYLGNNGQTINTLNGKLDENSQVVVDQQKAITGSSLWDIDDIAFSPDRQLAILKKESTAYLYDFNRYNIVGQDIQLYGENIGNVIWSPDQSRLAYFHAPAAGEEFLVFADLLNESPKNILPLPNFVDPVLQWSKNGEQILIINQSDKSAENKVYLFDVYSRDLKTLTDFGGVLGGYFTDNDQKILYFTEQNDPKNPIKSVASVMKIDGSDKKSLEVNAYPEKVFIQNDREIVFLTYIAGRERLILVNTAEETIVELYFEPPEPFNIEKVILQEKNFLYLLADSKLYGVKYQDNNY